MPENLANIYFMPTGPGELSKKLHWFCKVQLDKQVGDDSGTERKSQSEAAPLIGISQPHLSDILSLKKAPETLAWELIADWLTIPHDQFVARAMALWENGGKEAYERERDLQDAKRRAARDKEPPATVTTIEQAPTRRGRRRKRA
jgi:hypothetical protein